MGHTGKGLIFIRNFGCQMNLHDARRMEEALVLAGYHPASRAEDASVILLNTCSVRQKSQEKVRSALGRYAQLKAASPGLLLCVAGCVAQQEGARLWDQAPFIDLIIGPDHIGRLPELLEKARQQQQVQIGFLEPEGYTFLSAAPHAGAMTATALVTIQKGCDNACAYCIVPRVRGPEVSRPAAGILDEVRRLVAAGVKEVTLIGQNVNSYRGLNGRAGDFVGLLREVDRVAGLRRIRFTTSHPKDLSADLCRCFGELEHLCPWLHLPVQSGSNRVLNLMARGYTRERYLELVDAARQACPHLAVGTDLIVGFPGEGPSDFQDTMALIEELQLDYAYSFKYSSRPGTPAAALDDDVPEAEKTTRLHTLQQRQETITRLRLESFVGQRLPVLVEGPSRRGLPQICGRSPGNHVVNLTHSDPEGLVGEEVMVTITEAGSHCLFGEVSQCDPGVCAGCDDERSARVRR